MSNVLKLTGAGMLVFGVLLALVSPDTGTLAGLLMIAGLGTFVAGRFGQS